MKIKRNGMMLEITKENSDIKYNDTGWGSGESRLLYHIKHKINAGKVENWSDIPTTFVKKRMWKDGHLVDDTQQYLRTKKPIKMGNEVLAQKRANSVGKVLNTLGIDVPIDINVTPEQGPDDRLLGDGSLPLHVPDDPGLPLPDPFRAEYQ